MALTWDATQIKDWEKLEGNERVVTDALVFLSMFVGQPAITEKNAEEFFTRVKLYESLHGSYLHTQSGDRPITWKDIERRIGLKTNATTETWNQFVKRQTERFRSDTKLYSIKKED